MSGARHGLASVLGEPAFARYVVAHAISLVGTWMQRTAIGWLAWELTRSPAWLGLVAFADLAPGLLVAPFGGLLADRRDRRQILLLCQCLLALHALLLALLAFEDALGIRALVLLNLLRGMLIGINQPARLSYFPVLVTREQLSAAVAVNSLNFNLARILGPALAGLLLVNDGAALLFLINGLSFLLYALVLAGLPPAPPMARRREDWRGELAAALGFVTSGAVAPVFGLMVLSAVLVRPLGEMLPALSDRLAAGGPGTFAALSAALGAGAVAGALWLALRPPSDDLRALLLWLLLTPLALLVLVSAGRLAVALAAVLVCGAGLSASGVTAQSLVQKATPGALRGRTLSLYGVVVRSGPALGALAIGTMAERLGLAATLAAVALLALAGVLAMLPRQAGIAARLEGREDPHR